MKSNLSTKAMGFSVDTLTLFYISRLLDVCGYSEERIECAMKCFSRSDRNRISKRVLANSKVQEVAKWKSRSKKQLNEEISRVSILKNFNEMITNYYGKISHSRVTFENDSEEKYLCSIIVKETLCLIKDKIKKDNKKNPHNIEKELRHIFHLDDIDIELLRFAYCYDIDENEFQSALSTSSLKRYLKLISICTGFSVVAIRKALNSDSRLRKCGIFDSSPRSSRHSRNFDVNDGIKEYLDGLLGEQELLQNFVRIDNKQSHPIESFTIAASTTEILCDIMKNNNSYNILFHGEPGTGKTEYARSLAIANGFRPIFVNQKESSGSHSSDFSRETALIAALNIAAEKDVIIVDEADHLLNTKYMFLGIQTSMTKGRMNDLVDSKKTRIIWITNDIDYIADSQLRRFSYSLRFEKFGTLQREVIWKEVIRNSRLSGILSEQDISRLSDGYEVNAAGIANAVKVAEGIHSRKRVDAKTLKVTLDRILTPHEELITGKIRRRVLNPVAEQYDPSVLNTDIETARIIMSLERVVTALNNADKNAKVNANLLFYGMPGTGKTEFAKYLAEHLNKKIMVKRCSDLESMYVGETEKNIARAFREAEESGQILFIDEADTFFTERSGSMRSWEVSRTNEMLNQMENFRGIFICCTNMKKLLDDAAIRRFSFKVEFKSLRKEDRSLLFSKYFNIFGTLSSSQQLRIDSLDKLTPGDLRAVYNSYRYVSPKDILMDEIVGEVVREVSHKDKTEGKVVGF